MMTWALTAAGGMLGIGVLAFVAGSLLPRGHVSRVRARFSKPPSILWDTITDFSAWPSWNPNVKKMERQPDHDGKPVWLLSDANGTMPSRVERMRAPENGGAGEIVEAGPRGVGRSRAGRRLAFLHQERSVVHAVPGGGLVRLVAAGTAPDGQSRNRFLPSDLARYR